MLLTRRTLQSTLTVALAAGVLLSGSSVAVADDEADIGALFGSAIVSVEPISGGWRVCWHGAVAPAARTGTWTFTAHGLRGSEPYLRPVWTSSALSISECDSIYRNGSTEGWLSFDLGYASVNSYSVAHSTHGVTWAPQTGPRTYGVDPTP